MAATATTSRIPFADASPEEIRAVLLPEELPEFEEQYREALRVAAETYRLDKLEACLRSWRRIAWMTHSDPEAHRLMLARAEYTVAVRERAPATASVAEIKELLREHLGT